MCDCLCFRFFVSGTKHLTFGVLFSFLALKRLRLERMGLNRSAAQKVRNLNGKLREKDVELAAAFSVIERLRLRAPCVKCGGRAIKLIRVCINANCDGVDMVGMSPGV